MTDKRFDFPEYIVRVTGGKGSENFLVFGNEKAALIDAGIAYSSDKLIANIKEALNARGMQDLDYIFLSHSHYDHVGGVPALVSEFPGVKVVAAEKTKKVFGSNGALSTIKRLSEDAARIYGVDGISFDTDLLRVDIIAKDGDDIDLGGRSLRIMETKGHTDCSQTFIILPERIMFTSESTGVFRGEKVSSEIVKSYRDAVDSAKRCIAYKPSRIIVPHYGLVPEGETLQFFVGFLIDAELQRKMILGAFDKYHDVDKTREAFIDEYWKPEYEEHQPREAFLENARYLTYNILKEEGLI